MKAEIQKYATDALAEWAEVKGANSIPRKLAKKDKLTLGGWLWAHNAALISWGSLGVMATCLVLLFNEDFLMPFWLGLWGAVLISFATFLVAIYVWYGRASNMKEFRDVPSVSQRGLIELHERSRLNVPWAGKRAGRTREVDYRYDQYSVWIYPEDTSVVVSILRHTPWKDGKYKTDVYAFDFDLAKEFVGEAKAKELFLYDQHHGSFKRAEHKIEDPTPERVAQARHGLEEMAATLEEQAYLAARKKIDARRMALVFRRG